MSRRLHVHHLAITISTALLAVACVDEDHAPDTSAAASATRQYPPPTADWGPIDCRLFDHHLDQQCLATARDLLETLGHVREQALLGNYEPGFAMVTPDTTYMYPDGQILYGISAVATMYPSYYGSANIEAFLTEYLGDSPAELITMPLTRDLVMHVGKYPVFMRASDGSTRTVRSIVAGGLWRRTYGAGGPRWIQLTENHSYQTPVGAPFTAGGAAVFGW